MFLDILPPKLRLKVYHAIMDRTILTEDPTKRQDERLYSGLIFSCKQVVAEYKSEAEKRIPPISPTMHELSSMFYSRPALILPSTTLSYPTHLHVSVPAKLFVYEEGQVKDSQYYLECIFSEVAAHHPRITFSLHDTSSLDSKMRVYACLARLYNTVCDLAVWDKADRPSDLISREHDGGYRCDFDKAKRTWIEKGFEVRRGELPPYYNCDNVALYIDREVVVYDARMSKDELKGADSGYLWEEGNAIREENIIREKDARIEDE